MTNSKSNPARIGKTDDHGKPVVVFGIDDTGNPKAAKFSGSQADLAIKAAGLGNLHTHVIGSSEVADVAAKLPTGRIYANGRGFVPYVRRDLYAKFVGLIGHSDAGGTGGPTSDPGSVGRPHSWDEIGPGHLVLHHESREDGWWEAIVVARDGDILKLRYRDYPDYPPLQARYTAVALLKPDFAPPPAS